MSYLTDCTRYRTREEAGLQGVMEDIQALWNTPDASGRTPAQQAQAQGGSAVQAALMANPATAGLLNAVKEQARDAVVEETGKNAAALFALALAGGTAGGILFGRAGVPGAIFGLAIAGLAGWQIVSGASAGK